MEIRPLTLSLALIIALHWPVHGREYVVGVENIDYYPVSTADRSDYVGYARDLLDAFAAFSGHTIRYETMPIKRLYKQFLSHQVDFKYPDNPAWARERKAGRVIYSDPCVFRSNVNADSS